MNLKRYYQYCVVPCCRNNTKSTPDKLFIHVPRILEPRKRWLQLARKECDINLKTTMYFCEDHFDLPNDMENYIQFRIQGSVKKVRMKKGCFPSRFACQQDRKRMETTLTSKGLFDIAYSQIGKECHESENMEYGAHWGLDVKEERMDLLTEFEGVWNYHKVKEERKDLDFSQEQKLKLGDEKLKEDEMEFECAKEEKLEKDEEEVKPPLMILVQPNNGGGDSDKCEERNIFDEESGIPKVEDLSVEHEKESCAEMDFSSTSCSSSFPRQKRKLITSSSNLSCRSAKFAKEIPSGSCKNISIQKKRYECDSCSCTFGTNYKLTVHKRFHVGEHPYQCDKCHASFAQLCRLKFHKKKHVGERPYRCNVCGSSFAISSKLMIHERKHSGECPYHCDECDVSFAQLSILKHHKRTHTGERPYRCDVCDASFSTSSALIIHKRTHTGERPYHCDECSSSFSTSIVLRIHKRRHRGERPF